MSFLGVHSVLVTGGWTSLMPVLIPRTVLAGVGMLMVSGMNYVKFIRRQMFKLEYDTLM